MSPGLFGLGIISIKQEENIAAGVLFQGMVRKRIGVRALSVEFLLRQCRLIGGEGFLVFFALLAFWGIGRHGDVSAEKLELVL
jgi:hypothetical protein